MNEQLSKSFELKLQSSPRNPDKKYVCSRCASIFSENFMSEHILSHATEILPFLFIGSEENAHNKPELIEQIQITNILNVSARCKNKYIYCDNKCNCMDGCKIENFENLMFNYYHIKLNDTPEQNILAHFDSTINTIEIARLSGKRILIHCRMGVSRSATIIIAYLMFLYKTDFNSAFSFVKNKRPKIEPNVGFINQLKTYEKNLTDIYGKLNSFELI